MKRLEGKVAVITGANSGIGKVTAELFAKEGASVVLAARREKALQEVVDSINNSGGKAVCVAGDVSIQSDCIKIVEAAIEKFGKVDILVNNAGVADKHRPITRTDAEWWDNIIAINQNSVFYMCKEALKYMEEASAGSIINISSVGAVRSNSGVSYTASKTAVIGMSQNIGIQYAGKGIRCNVVCPGPTPTPLNTPEQVATFDSEFADMCNKHMAIDTPFVTAEDQANAILFFASDESKGINGQILTVDNGMSI